MPSVIQPMLATSVEAAFDDPDWLFEIKWDGYRAIAFVENGETRLVSRNQNDLSGRFPELAGMARDLKAKTAVLDGEIVALDETGRPSFSMIQQRTGFRRYGRQAPSKGGIPIFYYVFDLLYVDGRDLRRMPLDQRKAELAKILRRTDGLVRASETFAEKGTMLMDVVRAQGLEGIVAKRRDSRYEERRSSEWVKIKLRQQLECVIGGYTDPEGSRQHFGSVVLGLYDDEGHLRHVGQAGSGFNQRTLGTLWRQLQAIATTKSPFYGKVEALRRAHWVEPKLVAQIEFAEWTHSTEEGGPKLRAPVFLGLRDDKDPKECRMDQQTAGAEK